MTPTEQDKELRAKLAKTKTFNYDVYFGQDIANNCIPFEEALDEIMQLLTADRKRVELEARIETVMSIDAMLRFENIPLHQVQSASLKQYLRQLEAQQEEKK